MQGPQAEKPLTNPRSCPEASVLRWHEDFLRSALAWLSLSAWSSGLSRDGVPAVAHASYMPATERTKGMH
jgi:hypothetical protein